MIAFSSYLTGSPEDRMDVVVPVPVLVVHMSGLAIAMF
jgi:hypothetical protein